MFETPLREEQEDGSYGRLEWRLTVPPEFADTREADRAIYNAVRNVNRDFTRNLVRRIQAKLIAANLQKSIQKWVFNDSFHVASTASARKGEYKAGVWTDDPVYQYYEYAHGPRGIPPYGEGTPIWNWVENLRENPLPGYDYPITPYQVAWSVWAFGTGGKLVATLIVMASRDEYANLIDAAISRALSGLGSVGP